MEVPPAPGSSGDESSGRVGGARRGRSPLPKGRGLSLPPPPPPTSGNSSLRASPSTSSSMPHGLTVQELKELTKVLDSICFPSKFIMYVVVGHMYLFDQIKIPGKSLWGKEGKEG